MVGGDQVATITQLYRALGISATLIAKGRRPLFAVRDEQARGTRLPILTENEEVGVTHLLEYEIARRLRMCLTPVLMSQSDFRPSEFEA